MFKIFIYCWIFVSFKYKYLETERNTQSIDVCYCTKFILRNHKIRTEYMKLHKKCVKKKVKKEQTTLKKSVVE
jgi:hypothetical protein